MTHSTSPAFARQATVTANTKRSPAVSGGKRGAATTLLIGLTCTPLDPVQDQIAMREVLNTPHEVLETFVDGEQDIVEGDVLVVGPVEYPIRSVREWVWRGSVYRHLFLENLKR
jgi:hypothetical protein